MKHAAKICNYFPLKLDDGTWKTPMQLAHHTKADLRVLFKVFSLAAVQHEHAADQIIGKFESQSIPMIAIGRCPNSNGLQFYSLANGTFVSSINYKFQQHTNGGAHFGYKYQAGNFYT